MAGTVIDSVGQPICRRGISSCGKSGVLETLRPNKKSFSWWEHGDPSAWNTFLCR
jgi:hypothetical protein